MRDAPVAGNIPQVQARTLTMMVGGDADSYNLVESVLRELGTPTRIGENGQGLRVKDAINISLAVQMVAFAEGLVLAERNGVGPKVAVNVITQGPIGSAHAEGARAARARPPRRRHGSTFGRCTTTSGSRCRWLLISTSRCRPPTSPTRR